MPTFQQDEMLRLHNLDGEGSNFSEDLSGQGGNGNRSDENTDSMNGLTGQIEEGK